MREGPLEREIKLRVVGLAPIRQRLRRLGAVRVHARSFEDNLVLDRDGELRARGEVLRLRRDGQGVRLTWKGPARREGGVKERSEIELALSQHPAHQAARAQRSAAVAARASVGIAAALTLFAALGYRVVRRYQKRREEWRLGRALVALDDTPAGSFVELEGNDPLRCRLRLGLEQAPIEPRTYLELWAALRRTRPELPADMVFSPGKRRV